MEKTKLTIHGALRELKTLDSRIDRGISEVTIVGIKKNSSDKEFNTGKTDATFVKDANASLNSVRDLISRRDNIKRAIVISNATTIVNIDGCGYTVAEAIERKSSIQYEKELLANLKVDLRRAKASVSQYNARMEEALEKQIYNLTAGDSTKVESVKGFSDMFRADNSWELIDPLNAEEVINNLEERIESFLANVDEALSVSNAMTTIEV